MTGAARDALLDQFDQLQRDGLLTAAVDHWRQTGAAAHLQQAARFLNQRGIQQFAANRITEALTLFTLALRAVPEDAAALNNAATCLKELGRLADSTALYRQALTLQPNFAAAHSNILMALHYTADTTLAQSAAAHRQWDAQHAKPLRRAAVHTAPEPERALRIGLVSADLGQHPVGLLLVQYLEHSDRAQLHFIAYADGQRQGAITDRIKAACSAWHAVRGLTDDALADRITRDKIDILLDLGGHTADNRLSVFARKPAPRQISWLGYPGDTGLSAMDYVIGDAQIMPLSLQPHYTAKILQLPGCFVCFNPPDDALPVSPLPATIPGAVTFGCFSNPAKCGSAVIALWAQILTQLPQSRLLLKYKGFGEPLCQQDFTAAFAAQGVTADRLEFQGASPSAEMFQAMQAVDLVLDPFPFSGGLMTCLALWQGLPVLTLPGESFASRQGLSFLTAIGIIDTLATDRADYVAKAMALAHDLPRLGALRQQLRPAMAASSLCDGAQAAAGLQSLLRQVWRDYCAASHAAAPSSD